MEIYPGRSFPLRGQPPLSAIERLLVVIAAVGLAIGLLGFWSEGRRPVVREEPLVGGTFVEGVVADSPTKVERLIARLTNIGLTFRDHDGSIQPALAESFEVSGDNKTYTFRLRQGYLAEGLVATIKSNKTDWQGVEITAPDENLLRFQLNEPFGLFLTTTTKPLFPFGPYEIVKRDKKEVILRSNPEFVLGTPYIPKIVLKLFATREDLLEAVKAREITASADFGAPAPPRFTPYTLETPRRHVLFFNLTRPSLKRQEDRERILQASDGPPVTYTLLTNQSEEVSTLADELARQLREKNVNLNVVTKSSVTLQKEDIPKRDFDLLLYGVSYGIDPDYYSFWHSSQVTPPGLNIPGAKDKELDKLLEAGRREHDPGKRAALTKQIEDYLASHSLQKVVSQEKVPYWVDPSIKGVQYAKIDEGPDRYSLIWRWYSQAKKVRGKTGQASPS